MIARYTVGATRSVKPAKARRAAPAPAPVRSQEESAPVRRKVAGSDIEWNEF
jgi:hypothetical protein